MNRFDNIDCMIGMKDYPDKHFELAIVDPSYGIGMDGQKLSICKNLKYNRKEHIREDWDKKRAGSEYFDELKRVSKNQIIWGGNYFVENLTASKGWIIWDKGQRDLTMSDCELAYTSFDVPTRIITLNRVELLLEGTIHPTQKPIKLYKKLLHRYAKLGDRILDTHVGSASSLIACEDMGFEYVGFELDKDYYDAAQKRLTQFRSQLKLHFDKLSVTNVRRETSSDSRFTFHESN